MPNFRLIIPVFLSIRDSTYFVTSEFSDLPVFYNISIGFRHRFQIYWNVWQIFQVLYKIFRFNGIFEYWKALTRNC